MLALAALIALPVAAFAQTTPTILQGTVLERGTLRPLYARVVASTRAGTFEARTDKYGTFRLWNVAPGAVTLTFYSPSHYTPTGELCLRPGADVRLAVKMQRSYSGDVFVHSRELASAFSDSDLMDTTGGTSLTLQTPRSLPLVCK